MVREREKVRDGETLIEEWSCGTMNLWLGCSKAAQWFSLTLFALMGSLIIVEE